MRLLLASEFYAPSVGGVQEVMRQLAERFVRQGHQVTVATTRLAERDFSSLEGVEIVGFDVTGNLVRGMSGEVERYREFVRTFPCDALLVKAAQQWTFDALWPVLGDMRCRKVFIPCGFSGLYEPSYATYFEQLPNVLRQWDHLVFYAEHYRDVDFARAHGIGQFSILPNGASEIEFGVAMDRSFRRRNGIPEDSFVLLTVGTLTGMKGHREVAEAFARLQLPDHRHATLLLNGNDPPRPPILPPPTSAMAAGIGDAARQEATESCGERVPPLWQRVLRVARREGVAGVRHRIGLYMERPGVRWIAKSVRLPAILVRSLQANGVGGTAARIHRGVYERTRHYGVWRRLPDRWIPFHAYSVTQWLAAAMRTAPGRKLAVHTNFPRGELVQAYMAADLFVFASNIEYSPLVLYEAAAAGTPFLTVPVGNAEEIARWTGAGVVCPAPRDERGYTRAQPEVLAKAIEALEADPARLEALGREGRTRWERNFTWDVIARRYEAILAGRTVPNDTMVLEAAT